MVPSRLLVPANNLISMLLCGATALAAPDAADAADAAARAGEGGFSVSTVDDSFNLRFRTLVQSDARFYSGEQPSADGFLVRRARVELTGALYGRFDFRIMPDYSGTSTTLLDAWQRYRISQALKVQIGKVKQPVGLERAQSRENNTFNELAYPTALVPNRDIGINVQGELGSGIFTYYVGVFDGAGDGGSVVTDGDDSREGAALVFVFPTARAKETFGDLGLGVGGTYGTRKATPSVLRTVGQQTFYRWRDDVENHGTAWRVVPQMYWFRGPVGVLAEYARSSQAVRLGAESGEVEAEAWAVTASWVVTGEDATFRGVKPRRPIAQDAGGTGAWQIAARATGLRVGDEAFPLFSDPARSGRRARTAGVVVNWYLNRIIRMSLDYHRTDLDGGPLEEEDVVTGRAQWRF